MTATSLNESVIQTLNALEKAYTTEKRRPVKNGIRIALVLLRSNLLKYLLSSPTAPSAPTYVLGAPSSPSLPASPALTPAQEFEQRQANPPPPGPMPQPVRQELPVLWMRALKSGANAVASLIDQMRAQSNDVDAEKLAEVATAWIADGRLKPPVQDVDDERADSMRTDTRPGT